LGEIAVIKGDLMRAITHIEESLRFFHAQNDIPNIAAALHLLGDIKRLQGKLSEATALYNESALLNRR
jgi:tetratricopeptide (TPR) repeat protein